MPQMIIPLLVVGGWATLITCISHFWHNREFHLDELEFGRLSTNSTILESVGINNILLTVLGFVVGLSLSFRGSTAYER